MAPPASRGTINNVFQLSYDIGLFLADLIIFSVQRSRDSWGWRISLGMAAAPSFSLTLGALFIPETANSIIQRDIDFHRAVKTLQTIRGTTDILAELNDIMTAGNARVTTKESFYRITRCMQVLASTHDGDHDPIHDLPTSHRIQLGSYLHPYLDSKHPFWQALIPYVSTCDGTHRHHLYYGVNDHHR